jgi:hypothetical protein
VLAAVFREWDWPARPGLSEAAAEVIGYLERNAHRMDYPEYLAKGWCFGSGAVESACKTVVGQRLKLAGGKFATWRGRSLFAGEWPDRVNKSTGARLPPAVKGVGFRRDDFIDNDRTGTRGSSLLLTFPRRRPTTC